MPDYHYSMLNHIIKLFILSAVLSLVACSAKEDKNTSKPPNNSLAFDAVIVNSFPINRTIEVPGTILSNEIADLHPEVAGRVTGIFFKEGSYVKKGTLLASLYNTDLYAQLQKLSVQLKINELNEKRQSELLAINGTSQQDYDNALLAVSNTKADIKILKVNISKTEIRAPFDGKIGLRQVSPGAYVSPQNIITNISNISQLKIDLTVPEKYTPDLPVGKSISFRTERNDKDYFATIIATENTIVTETRNLKIRALITNADASLKAGAFATVKVAIGANTPTMMIPTQAVIPQTRGKKVIVLRNQNAVFQNVETGYRDSASVEILSGLMNGDTVLTSGLLVIKPNQKIGKLNIKK